MLLLRAAPRRARALRARTAASPARAASTAAEIAERHRYWNDLFSNGGDVFTLNGVSVAPNLESLWPRLTAGVVVPASGVSRCLMPFVGRDISLGWVARQQNWGAVGVDFSDAALRMLGAELGGLVPLTRGDGAFSAYQCGGVPRALLVHGDFLALDENAFGGSFEAAWDRGGITAAIDRDEYAVALAGALAKEGRALVELLSTNVQAVGACAARDVEVSLTRAGFSVELLLKRDVRADYPAFRPPGLRELDEVVLLATKT